MPLPAVPASRTRKHIRSVRSEGYTRVDGLYYPRWRREAETGTD
jgi:hypothetical protein